MSVGKLYQLGDNQFIGNVNYRLFHHPEAINQCGELTPINYVRLGEGNLFVIELEEPISVLMPYLSGLVPSK